jgi:hypothetical protein
MMAAMAKPLSAAALAYFREQGKKGGKLGGAKAWASLTAAERSARAKKASLAGVKARRKKAAARKAKATKG